MSPEPTEPTDDSTTEEEDEVAGHRMPARPAKDAGHERPAR